MKDYRILFTKTGSVKYISHLDLNRCMIRAIRRSGLPAWYTEGFHPHLYLMFPLALSLGAESVCECMDFRLTQELPAEEILARLNAALPPGLEALRVGEPLNEAVEIGAAVYELTLAGKDLQPVWEAFLAQPEIPVEKKTKKGMKTIDIRPQITQEAVSEEDGMLHLTLRLPAGNEGNLNASVVTDAFVSYAAGQNVPVLCRRILRTKIFCLDGKDFF